MVKKLLITLIVLMLISPIVLAAVVKNTELTVNTDPEVDLMIQITDADNGNKVQTIDRKSDTSGILQATIYSMGVEEVNLNAVATKDFAQLYNEDFGPYSVDGAITITLKGEVEEEAPVNETVTEEETVTETDTEAEGSLLTGKSIIGDEGIIKPKSLLYLLLIAAAGVVIFFGYRFVVPKISVMNVDGIGTLSKSIVVKKQSDMLKEQEEIQEARSIGNKKIDELEKKMKEINAELNKIKNDGKIKDAEKKLREDMDKLNRLKRGEDIF